MIKFGGNFLFFLPSRAMLYFMDQVSRTCMEEDLRLWFQWEVCRTQHIDKHLIEVWS